MYIFSRTITQTLKTFLISFVCSVIFALMIYRESALPDRFICSILNLTALLLFLFLHYLSWAKLYYASNGYAEYFIPTLTSTTLLTIVAGYLYHKRFFMYMWFFLPTRFLEPMLTTGWDFVSFLLAQAIMYILVFLTPSIAYRNM